jgi:cell division protein FtsQ
VWERRRLRVALLLALCLPALAVGGWMLLRNTSLSSVEHVRVSGVHGREAAQIDAALVHAARGMSTLHVKTAALRAAVARFPVVRDLRVTPSFPHGLRIRVIEQPPVATLVAAGVRTAVAADGVVLGPESMGSTLPSVRLSGVAPLPGGRVADVGARAELSILGGAPGTLLGWVRSVSSGSVGLVATMRNGLEIYFGNATRPHAKWLAAARVLADPSSAGATYIDVRLPERPVAGSSAPGGLSGAATSSGAGSASAATLTARLDEAVAGGSATTAATGAGSPSAASEKASGESTSGESAPAESTSGGSTPTESGSGEASSGESSSGESSVGETGASEAPQSPAGGAGGASEAVSSGG